MQWREVDFKLRRLLRPRPFELGLFAREAVFSSLLDGIIVLDKNGCVVEMNPSAQMMLNQNLEHALGNSIEQVFRQANLLEDWTSSRADKMGFVIGTNGDRQLYEIRVHPLCDEKNLAEGRLILLHDITEQQCMADRLEEHSKELRQLAVLDELTGIANRRQLFDVGERELVRARHFGHPFSIVILDIDHFKRINDTYSPPTGDRVLKAIVPILQKNIRDTDLLARYGGEEFAIVLPETNLASACQVAERLRKTIAESPIPIGNETVRLTISLGVAETTAETRQLEDLLSAADNAMDKAKQAGRNRIFFADHSLARHFYFDFLPA